MGIETGQVTHTLKVQDRAFRVEVRSEVGQDPQILFDRETVGVDETGAVVTRDRNGSYVRSDLSTIKDRTFGGLTATALLQALFDMGDALRQEDIVAQQQTAQEEANSHAAIAEAVGGSVATAEAITADTAEPPQRISTLIKPSP